MRGPSPAEIGRKRDAEIVALAGRLPITARQAAALWFRVPSGLRLARRRLHALAERGELLREWAPEIGWVYATRRDALGRKLRHGVRLAALYVALRASGRLQEWEQEVTLPGGQADARTVLAGIGEVWWEVERDRAFDRWDLYRERAVCVWTTETLAGQKVPTGVRGAVGGWGEDPLAIARRLPVVAQRGWPERSLRAELAGVGGKP